MSARTLILLVVAVILAVGTAMLARSWLATERTRQAAQVAATPVAPRATRSVLIARASITRGQILKPDNLVWQAWPDGGIDPSYIVSGGAKTPQTYTGWVAVNPISAGEPLTEGKIIKPGDRSYLAAVLRPGMRAVSVPVTLTTAISGLIFPGDYVDLLDTYLLPPPPGGTGRGNQVAETVLRHVRVISIDSALQGTAGQAFPRVQNATLEVTPKQSEIVVVANEIGKMSLTLDSLQTPEASGSDKQTAAADARAGDDSPTPVTADSPGAMAPTYTFDSEVSSVMPDASRTVTILRGAAKTRETVDWSQLIGGERGAAKPAGGT